MSWPLGRLSQTKYILHNIESKIRVIRRHHPLVGQDLGVLSVSKTVVVVRLPNGSSLKVPRQWTDADGAPVCQELQGESKLCIQGLGELLRLLEALRKRTTRAAP